MNTSSAVTSARMELGRGFAWLGQAWTGLQQHARFWFCLAGIYLLIAAMLGRIPFAGYLLVVMLSPMLLAGALLTLTDGAETAATASAPSNYQRYLAGPLRSLTRALAQEKYVFSMVLLGIVTVGMVMLLRIAQYLLGVGALGNIFSSSAGAVVAGWWRWTGGLLVLMLNISLLMSLFYAVHRTVLAERDPMQAVHDSFTAVTRHATSHVVYLVAFALAYVLIGGAFSWSQLAGYLTLFAVGVPMVALYIHASYRSYRHLFDGHVV